MLRPSSLAGSSSPLALLNRDSEYLHRQHEGATGARSPRSVQRLELLRRQLGGSGGSRSPSAVERLEADKAKYVKTQQVIDSRQDPALATSPACARKLLSAWSEPGPHCAASSSKATSSRQGSVLRRSSGRRLMRPDSLIMYRQQRDCKSVNKENASGLSLVRRLFHGNLRESDSDTTMDPAPFEGPVPWTLMEKAGGPAAISTCSRLSPRRVDTPCLGLNVTIPQSPSSTPRSPHPNSHSHQSSYPAGHSPQCLCPHSHTSAFLQHGDVFPQSINSKNQSLNGSLCGLPLKMPLSQLEKEQFFNFCGLDEMDFLNKQGVSPVTDLDGTSSVSSVESRRNAHSQDSDFDEASSAEEGLQGRTRTPISIIERNARVIRWLYSCQKAQTTRKKSTRQESTKQAFIKLESTV